jgi:hypothetical protein
VRSVEINRVLSTAQLTDLIERVHNSGLVHVERFRGSANRNRKWAKGNSRAKNENIIVKWFLAHLRFLGVGKHAGSWLI